MITEAFVAGSDVASTGNVTVRADTDADIAAITAATGASKGTMAAAGSVSVNVVSSDTTAHITGNVLTGVDAGGSVAVTAENDSNFVLIAGAVGASANGAAGIGVSTAILVKDTSTTAYIGAGAIVKGHNLYGNDR